MTPHEINILIERYLDGETTLAEERELALAVQREDRPAEWAIIAEMLGELTVDEAVWTLPHPLPEWRVEVTTSINSSQETTVSTPLHSGRGMGWVRWAAAACITLAFGLSYNIIKEEPKKTAKTQLQAPQKTQQQEPKQAPAKAQQQAPAKAQQQAPAKAQQQAPAKAQQPLLTAAIAPSNTVLSCDASHDNTVSPADNTPTSTSNAPKEAPLPKPQPQLIAELEEATPPEDLSLCMALIAEVEARAALLQKTQQPPPLPLPEWRGEVTTSINDFSEVLVSTPSAFCPSAKAIGRDGVGLLLDELLANIQQQSNRPELSL